MKHIAEADELKDKELGGEMKAEIAKLSAEYKKIDMELTKLRTECHEKDMVIARHNDNNPSYNAMSDRLALAVETVTVLRGQVHQLMAETAVDKAKIKMLEQGLDGY